MNTHLSFSNKRVLPDISAAMPFRTSLTKSIFHSRAFVRRIMPLSHAAMFCKQIDTITYHHRSIGQFLSDNEVGIGNKRFTLDEVNRVETRNNNNNINGIILGFPFKCAVPIKTNYHDMPDFGEMMFLYRLGKICSEIEANTGYVFTITILEETEALSPVFGDT